MSPIIWPLPSPPHRGSCVCCSVAGSGCPVWGRPDICWNILNTCRQQLICCILLSKHCQTSPSCPHAPIPGSPDSEASVLLHWVAVPLQVAGHLLLRACHRGTGHRQHQHQHTGQLSHRHWSPLSRYLDITCHMGNGFLSTLLSSVTWGLVTTDWWLETCSTAPAQARASHCLSSSTE